MTIDPPNINPNKSDMAIAQGLAEAGEPVPDTVRLSSGVVLRVRPANTNILIKVMTKIQRPEPPLYQHPGMGRMIENPDDPDYIKRVQAWEMDYSNSMLTAMISLGTEIATLPKGFEGPAGDEWLHEYEMLGLPTVPGNAFWRYQAWVMFKAAPEPDDTKNIIEAVGRKSGIKEAAVKAATDFREGDKA